MDTKIRKIRMNLGNPSTKIRWLDYKQAADQK